MLSTVSILLFMLMMRLACATSGLLAAVFLESSIMLGFAQVTLVHLYVIFVHV